MPASLPCSSSAAAASRTRRSRATPKPDVAEGPRARLAELPAAARADARAQAAHGLRRSALPEHRRVLAPRHGDVHDHGRRLHARVRLLQRHARRADRARSRTSRRTSRTPSRRMELAYVVVTSVDRDDLPDFGAGAFAATIRAIKARRPECRVEVLIPDFQGQEAPLRTVLDARPDVLNHNTETVPRLYRIARPGRPVHARARAARPRAHAGRRTSRPRPASWSASARRCDEVVEVLPRPAQRRLPDSDDRPVPAPVARAPADGALLHARRIPRAQAHRARARLRPRRVRPARAQLVSRARTGRELCGPGRCLTLAGGLRPARLREGYGEARRSAWGAKAASPIAMVARLARYAAPSFHPCPVALAARRPGCNSVRSSRRFSPGFLKTKSPPAAPTFGIPSSGSSRSSPDPVCWASSTASSRGADSSCGAAPMPWPRTSCSTRRSTWR